MDLAGPPMGDEIIRSHLHGFWGGIWPARGGWGEKMRKNVRKKTKNAHKCAQMRTKDTWQDQKECRWMVN